MQRSKPLTSLLVLALWPLSSSCGDKRVVEPIKPPTARLTCTAEPPVPAQTTDRTVSEYIIALVDAGRSCRSQLLWIKEYYDGM